jgi:hypothetical protein
VAQEVGCLLYKHEAKFKPQSHQKKKKNQISGPILVNMNQIYFKSASLQLSYSKQLILLRAQHYLMCTKDRDLVTEIVH